MKSVSGKKEILSVMTVNELLHNMNFDPALLYEAISRSTDDYIYIGDLRQNLFLVTENMYRDYNLPGRIVPDLVALWGERVHERDKQRYFDDINRMLAGETDEHNLEYQICTPGDEYIWIHCRGILKRDSRNEPELFAGVVTRLSDRGRVDQVTGLLTQGECEERLGRLLENPHRSGGGIILLGLDDFKRINNLHNHLFGNGVLRQFAQAVQQSLPEDARLFRFDGDQFAVVVSRGEREELQELYRKIHAYANRQHEIDGRTYFCTVSAGIAMMGEDSDNSFDLLKFAAGALEEAKRRGKNSCRFFTQDIIRATLRQMELASLLQDSVRRDFAGFSLVYQPLTDLRTMTVYGAEALLRWKSGELGEVSPAEFVPVLEKNELIVLAGKWVFEEAVRTCRDWTTAVPDFVMNINISYMQLFDDDFVPFVRDLLQRYEVDPSRIVLELTESCFVTDLQILKKTFTELRKLAVRIAMDDFGTGYSSLGLLSRSPADIVKIDRIFISAKGNAAFTHSFIGAVVQLCHSVGISVCVEGVERQEELETVRSLQADTMQGFYVSRPIARDVFAERYLSGADKRRGIKDGTPPF